MYFGFVIISEETSTVFDNSAIRQRGSPAV
jgi:hypothetical protein